MNDSRVERWLAALIATPGLTSIDDPAEARRVHLDDALAALDLVTEGPVVDVGSGGGSPGLPLAAARPDLSFTLLEATSRKCDFLRAQTEDFPNVEVVCARAEEYAAGEGRDAFAVALARALASPPVAVEWCLPLVRPGGHLVLYAGDADENQVATAAAEVAGRLVEIVPVPGSDRRRLLVVEKTGATPERFPRRSGAAKKRPLA